MPNHDAARHSGAGRIGVLRMRTMCLAESGSSTSMVSLNRLLDGAAENARDSGLTIPGIASLITKGGWRGLIADDEVAASSALRDHLTQISHVDVPLVSGKRRDPAKVNALLRSLARNTATEVAITTLAADAARVGESLDRDSATAYLGALERLMVVEDQPAWAPALRSRIELRSSPRRRFVDPSLAVALLRANPTRLLGDLEAMGLLFESLVIRDLRVLAQPLGGRVLHYRDNKGLEVDAVVVCDDGRWGAFEVKLGSTRIDEAAENLLAFARKVDTSRWGEPGVLGAVTGTGHAYRRKDGCTLCPSALSVPEDPCRLGTQPWLPCPPKVGLGPGRTESGIPVAFSRRPMERPRSQPGSVLIETLGEWQVNDRRYLSEASINDIKIEPSTPSKEVAIPQLAES